MKRQDYYTLSIILLTGLVFIPGGISSLYESYLEGRIIKHSVDYDSSVMIGNDSCYTAIWDDTINFTCGGIVHNVNNFYGGMWYHNHTATVQTFASAGVYYTLFMTHATNLDGFKAGNISFMNESYLEVITPGIYKADFMAIGSGENNHIYATSIFINDVNQDNCENHHKMTAGGDIITQNGLCFINLSVGDIVKVKTADFESTGSGMYYGSNINLVRIGNQ